MSPELTTAIIVAGLAVAAFAIHRIFPSVTVKSAIVAAETEAKKLATDVKSELPDLEADAMAALQKSMSWLTDTSSEMAAKAAADASIAKKAALKAQAIAKLNAPA